MLEQKDLQAIEQIVNVGFSKTEKMLKETNERVSAIEKKVDGVENKLTVKIANVEKKVDDVESKLTDKIETEARNIREVERMLVNELVRTEDILSRGLKEVKEDVKELKKQYQVIKWA